MELKSIYEQYLPKLRDEEYEALKESIQKEGLLFPIIVNDNNEILDGHNRYRACKELQIEPTIETKTFHEKLEEKRFVIEINLKRRHLNDYQKAEMGMILLEVEKELAKQRMSKGGGSGVGSRQMTTPQDKGHAQGHVAKQIGLSEKTFERAVKIVEKGTEEQKDLLRKGEESISGIYDTIMVEEQFPKDILVEHKKKKTPIKKLRRIGQKTRHVKTLLNGTTDDIRKDLEKKYEDKMFTEDLSVDQIEKEINVREGNPLPLEKEEVEDIPTGDISGSIFSSEDEAKDYFEKKGGSLKDKKLIWIGEIDPSKDLEKV